MIKFKGFDDHGNVAISECHTHDWANLPMKGLGKSMEGVGLNEPVIIPTSAALEGVIWGYTEAEIERRAYELKAKTNYIKLPPRNCADAEKLQVWFSPI